MLFDATQMEKDARAYYDKMLDAKLDHIAELSGVDRAKFGKINPADFIEPSEFQNIDGYHYQQIGAWLREHKTDDNYLISPMDDDQLTANQISFKEHINTERIRASKCALEPIPARLALQFFRRNHRQSLPRITSASISYGLIYHGQLMGVMTYDKTAAGMHPGFGKFILSFLNKVSSLYLTVIRGTPVLVQLMIAYFVIFVSLAQHKTIIAIIAFGINSGAYVAEIIRSGIMSIDNGQFEAGRSLGFNYAQTLIYIIIPQAFKNVLPALANEFIVLIKETSVSCYIGLHDLTKGGEIIRSRTYTAFMPLLAVALIYLVIVMFFSRLVTILERRLRNSER